jgi:hypothetical protein
MKHPGWQHGGFRALLASKRENYLPNAQNGMCWARMPAVIPNEGMIAV